jgi:hypothetical protein
VIDAMETNDNVAWISQQTNKVAIEGTSSAVKSFIKGTALDKAALPRTFACKIVSVMPTEQSWLALVDM